MERADQLGLPGYGDADAQDRLGPSTTEQCLVQEQRTDANWAGTF